jgi:hypothetical protein
MFCIIVILHDGHITYNIVCDTTTYIFRISPGIRAIRVEYGHIYCVRRCKLLHAIYSVQTTDLTWYHQRINKIYQLIANCVFSTVNFADNSLSNKPRFLERQVLCNYSMNCLKISDLTSINVVCNFWFESYMRGNNFK